MPSPSEPSGAHTGHRSTLGRTVRSLRQGRGLTLRELADLIGVSPATLSGIENGNTGVSSQRVSQIAQALDVPVERLFASVPDVAPSPHRPASRPGASAEVAESSGGPWREFAPLRLDAALGGALSSFVEFGYHGATMRTIALRANLSVPGLYHYYSSKQEMLVALLDLTMRDLRARTEAAREEGVGSVARLTNLVECLALFHTHRRELAFVGATEMRSLSPGARARVAALRVGEQRMVDTEVEQGARAGVFETPRPHEAARAVVTMCTALAQWWRPDGPASAESVAAQYVDFALDLVRCTDPRTERGSDPTRPR